MNYLSPRSHFVRRSNSFALVGSETNEPTGT